MKAILPVLIVTALIAGCDGVGAGDGEPSAGPEVVRGQAPAAAGLLDASTDLTTRLDVPPPCGCSSESRGTLDLRSPEGYRFLIKRRTLRGLVTRGYVLVTREVRKQRVELSLYRLKQPDIERCTGGGANARRLVRHIRLRRGASVAVAPLGAVLTWEEGSVNAQAQGTTAFQITYEPTPPTASKDPRTPTEPKSPVWFVCPADPSLPVSG